MAIQGAGFAPPLNPVAPDTVAWVVRDAGRESDLFVN